MTITHSLGRRALSGVALAVAGALLVVGSPALPAAAATSASYPSDTTAPNLTTLLSGYYDYWQPETDASGASRNSLHGTVTDTGKSVLARNDELASWINQHATASQRFRALQNAQYKNDPTQYDQSQSIADGLGAVLGGIYAEGRRDGKLPLTDALINSQTGTSGAYVGSGAAKTAFSYPRPFLPLSPAAALTPGDDVKCSATAQGGNTLDVNASSLQGIRPANAQADGYTYTDAQGDLKITRVAPMVDTTHVFSNSDVALDAGYGQAGICTGGAFPSGHTLTAYQAGLTLATLIPELAPEVLARTSEAGNNRIVLGVHYPLDIMGSRTVSAAVIAHRWADDAYRTQVLEPARHELVSYLESKCGDTLAHCIAEQNAAGQQYQDDPYGGQAIPGGTSQIVTDRASAVKVYTERLTYGFPATSAPKAKTAAVPAEAQALLQTTYPQLTAAQRTSVLQQTEIPSGYPLSDSAAGWQQLNLAAATSAKVEQHADGSVAVLSVGVPAEVVTPAPATPATPSPSVVPSASAPASATVAPQASGRLPKTGAADATLPIGIAAGLVGLGLVSVLVSRRARRRVDE
ncbi:MAG: phosphatase PAP2 family protein [Pseudoclavibacter sp.]